MRRGLELARARLHRAQPPRLLVLGLGLGLAFGFGFGLGLGFRAVSLPAASRSSAAISSSRDRSAAPLPLASAASACFRGVAMTEKRRHGRETAKTARWCRCAADTARH